MADTIVKSTLNDAEGIPGRRDVEFLETLGGYPSLKRTLCLSFVTRGLGSELDREIESVIGERYTVKHDKKVR